LCAADFLSGFFHWLEDTYGSYQWPAVLQRWIVLDNIAHHRTPAKFTRCSWFYRNQITIFVCAGLAVLMFAGGVRTWQIYCVLSLSAVSNEIHAWAHQKTVPMPVAVLQRLGVLQSRWHHGEHHRSPYAVRFCTTTNFVNPILDRLRFWRFLESLVLLIFGITPKRVSEARGGF
jgi:hypothetical protein